MSDLKKETIQLLVTVEIEYKNSKSRATAIKNAKGDVLKCSTCGAGADGMYYNKAKKATLFKKGDYIEI